MSSGLITVSRGHFKSEKTGLLTVAAASVSVPPCLHVEMFDIYISVCLLLVVINLSALNSRTSSFINWKMTGNELVTISKK